MNRIFSKKSLPRDLIRLEISTSIALKAIEPGQYIVVRTSPCEAGLALPVIKADPGKGTVTVIACSTDKYTGNLALMSSGSHLHSVEGPYGIPLQIQYVGTVLCVADEKGVAVLLPLMASLRKAGNRVVALLTALSAQRVLLEEEISALADELIILTKDSCQGQMITLQQGVARAMRKHSIQGVFVAGSARSIRDTFSMTINRPGTTQALLVEASPGKRVHGIFKVSICPNVRSVCVDGHDFNAYYATFDELVRRFEQGEMVKKAEAPTP